MELHPQPTALPALLQRLRDLLAAQPRADGVVLSVVGPERPLPVLMIDPQRLEQVLLNLGGNAVKFTSLGRITLRVTLLDDPLPAQGPVRLRFALEDTGVGIPPDQLRSIFIPFVQADSGLARSHEGTGLGLSTSAEMVRLMGSELQVRSELGVGSCFWFDLVLSRAEGPMSQPAAGGAAVAATVAAGAGPADAPSVAGLTVLVVDDNRLNLLVTRKVLGQEGVTVHEAAGPREAHGWFDSHPGVPLDAILMDLHMPDVDGITLTRQLRQRLGNALPPVLAVSGAVTDDTQSLAREVGMVAFIPKPFERATLVQGLALAVPGPRRVAPAPAAEQA